MTVYDVTYNNTTYFVDGRTLAAFKLMDANIKFENIGDAATITFTFEQFKKEFAEFAILLDENLLENFCNEFNKKIVGEYDNRKAIFLTLCGLFVANARTAAFNFIVNSTSGTGKDHTLKNILGIFPKPKIVHRTRISPTVLNYWHTAEKEPEWTWDGKILYLSDVSNAVLNSEVVKTMATEGSKATITVNQRAVEITINGKPLMAFTTASANPNVEALRRFPIFQLDESKDQTKEIKKRQARAAATGETLEYDFNYTRALTKLKPVKVKIPFAESLPDEFTDDHVIMRTHFGRMLDYIKTSTALHQYQRETDAEGYVIATGEDYDNAAIIIEKTTTNHLMIPLTSKQKDLLAIMKDLKTFTVSELSDSVAVYHKSKLYDAVNTLHEHGFIEQKTIYSEETGIKRPVKQFQYKQFEDLKIPKFSELKSCRKKGIKGTKGNKGKEGNKGNNTKKPINSPYSLNSPAFLTYKNDILAVVPHKPTPLLEIYTDWYGNETNPNIAQEEFEQALQIGVKEGKLLENPNGHYSKVL